VFETKDTQKWPVGDYRGKIVFALAILAFCVVNYRCYWLVPLFSKKGKNIQAENYADSFTSVKLFNAY